jgi:hypothetical protein
MERMTSIRITAGFACAALMAAVFAAGCGKATSPTSSGTSSGAGTGGTSSTVAGIAYDAANTMQSSDSLALRPQGRNDFFGLPLGIPKRLRVRRGLAELRVRSEHAAQRAHRDARLSVPRPRRRPQAAYDSIATASIHFTSHLSGTTTSGPCPPWTMRVT